MVRTKQRTIRRIRQRTIRRIRRKPTRGKRIRSRRRRRSKKTQSGGFCPPCLVSPLLGATVLGGTGYLVSRSSKSRTINGKTSVKRKEVYEMKKNGKKIRKIFMQDGLKLVFDGKEVRPKPKTITEAKKLFNKSVKDCIGSGFRKCKGKLK